MKNTTTQLSRLFVAVTAATMMGCGGSAKTESDFTVVDPAVPVTDWQLIWSDEFDGSAIDTNKWTHEVNCAGGGNNEKQCYTDDPANSFLADGMLHIVALPAEEGAEKPYTSARLNTRYKGDFKYGRFEMRAKLPSGQGSWPAFWMLPTDYVYGGWPRSGEIDIMEAVNLKVADADGNVEAYVHGTLHYGQEWPNNKKSGKAYLLADGANPADDFHTYAIEWQEGEIRWYMDGYLYATQRKSTVRYDSKDQAVGLSHRGWFTEYYDQVTGELKTYWNNAPFDQEFHLLLNLAVGGDWPENVNNLGIDAEAFANGQEYVIDYVRVYECASDPDTGRGCETIRPGYESLEDALVEGAAPIPTPPSSGVVQNLTIFDDAANPNWPAWDCCGGSTPMVIDDPDMGAVTEFYVGAQPTVNGFISRGEFITDENGQASPFDGSGMLESGVISFDMKIVSAPGNPDSVWMFKVESNNASSAVEIELAANRDGVVPTTGEWQTYVFTLQSLADAGLDVSAIDVLMIFPAWGTGEGAVYQMDNVKITAPSPEVVFFDDGENPNWVMWDCCGGSMPTEELDDDAHGLVAQFSIGASPTVMGFITRSANGGGDTPFDASSILDTGVFEFEMKVVDAPSNPDASWLIKLESDNAASAVELPITASQQGVAPTTGEWQTYTFKLADLSAAGLDVSAIDVIMIFPAWGTGEGAVYRVDNAKIYDPSAESANGISLFADVAAEGWSIWDCCGGSTPTVETDDDNSKGAVAQFIIGEAPTVMGILADDGVYYDAANLLATGVVRFDMKVVSAPSNPDAVWKFKIESGDAATAVELDLTDSVEGAAPVTGQWQTYTFTLQTLFNAGLDISAIDVVMVFPAWGTGNGAVYRLDNVEIVAE
ncbi:glycoside hydrolase family 16 protein [Aestuariibacter sp. GS-14]|uniref:glycoside hydrolase family 16 protein n=1 Tax=Aestuariibacter sp. GS-14 TaxID=2590670 RepID=UPI00112CA630|nr:glycoside hydrolase family 16 protein [Aestuariibacter sp. GS-14]TPV59722.1 glycoside hydrolase family 16 protein [Aestuariibacter sp. GS-14]